MYLIHKFPRKLPLWLLAILPVILAAWIPATAQSAQAQQVQAQPVNKPARSTAKRAKKRKQKTRRSKSDDLTLRSRAFLVVDQDSGEVLSLKNPDAVLPIASLTKLMTALVVVEAKQPMDEILEITHEDLYPEKKVYSRLKPGTRLSRDQMLLLALMSSENRAALALSRHYPGGRAAFLARMNAKAKLLGMTSTHFAESAGLSKRSVSTVRDLNLLLGAAYREPLIRSYSTHKQAAVRVNGRVLTYTSSNQLVRKGGDWNIGLQKTGFTNEAGRCLMMQTTVLGRRLAMIFLDSNGTLTRYGDAARVRHKLEREAKTQSPRTANH